MPLTAREHLQFEWSVLARYMWLVSISGEADEQARVAALQEELSKNPELHRDPVALYNTHMCVHENSFHLSCVALLIPDFVLLML